MVLSVLLQLVWIVVTVVVAVDVLYVLLIDRMVDTEHAPCVNLKHYGQSRRPPSPPANLPIALAGKVVRSVVSVCPSFSTLSIEPTDLRP